MSPAVMRFLLPDDGLFALQPHHPASDPIEFAPALAATQIRPATRGRGQVEAPDRLLAVRS